MNNDVVMIYDLPPTLASVAEEMTRYFTTGSHMKAIYEPKKIIRSGDVTVVFWSDDSKTIVRCQKEDLDDDYTAFCAALGKKVFGSNSALKKTIGRNLVIQPKTKYRSKREHEEQEVAKLKEFSAEDIE